MVFQKLRRTHCSVVEFAYCTLGLSRVSNERI